MSSLFDESPIELTCPHCSHKFSELIGKLKANPELTCGSCNGAIQISADGLNSALGEVDDSLADLGKAIERFNKHG